MNSASDHRPARLCRLLNHSVSALLVSSVANIRYLLGGATLFDQDFGGALLVAPEATVLIVDSRYTAQAKGAGLPCQVEPMSESLWDTLASVIDRLKLGSVGFESHILTVAKWRHLEKRLSVKVVPTKGLVEKLRLIKEDSEIKHLAEAARITDAVFSEIIRELKPGLSERDIAMNIDLKMRLSGADRPGFDTIVASGPNSAWPHAGAGQRTIADGDLIKIDLGVVFKGYHSDMTRTVALGRVSARQKEVHRYVVEAQELVLAKLAPEKTGAEADQIARDYFESIGLAANFGHNLGHGLGLEVHEQPTLGKKNNKQLDVGSVFTVEPGLYFPGLDGVRIEDMVVMRAHGPEVMTKSPRELVVV